MNLYLAASSDTKSKASAYAFQVGDNECYSYRSKSSTAPRELLIGMRNMFDWMLKRNLDEKVSELMIISNSEYIINLINERKIISWKESNWIRDNGEPVANVDVIKSLYPYIMYFKERNKDLIAIKPKDTWDVSKFNSVAKKALFTRKGY